MKETPSAFYFAFFIRITNTIYIVRSAARVKPKRKLNFEELLLINRLFACCTYVRWFVINRVVVGNRQETLELHFRFRKNRLFGLNLRAQTN